jgi:hypothetical protein
LRPKGTMLTSAAFAVALAVAATPADGARRPAHLGVEAAARAKAPSGFVLGGITPAGWPVVVATNRAATRVDQVVIGLDMTCTSGDSFGMSDGFQKLKLSRRGRFSTSLGPARIDAGGFPADVESKVIGRFDAGRASMHGIWSLKITIYEAAGTAVTDTCESGLVRWTAVQ